tara:strand:+ start:3669 stop:3920 length:252 start_codon:yes stop_codon:yes gene_type:complete
MKTAIAITILFFMFVFGLPIMAMLNTAHIITGQSNVEQVLKDIEQKKLKLKMVHEKQLAENMKALHDGTYKAKPWKGIQIDTQ